MAIYDQKQYREFFEYIDNQIKTVFNGLVVTLPGMGLSYFIKSYLAEEKRKVDYYSFVPDKLENEFSVIECGSDNIFLLEKIDGLLKKYLNKKIILCINQPYIIETEKFKGSFFGQHNYSVYYLKKADFESCSDLCKEIKPMLSNLEVKQIYELSGGVRKAIKYFCLNFDKHLAISDDETKLNKLKAILQPTADAMAKCSNEILTCIGISKDNPIYKIKPKLTVDIDIRNDLTFLERNRSNPNKLTKLEKNILEYLISHDLFMSKEEVSDIKWGEGKYDSYSDQAINKAMNRLNKKLMFHQIKTITKSGFKLIGKDGA